MILCGLIYSLVGFLVTALPPVPWLWPVVLVALGLHIGAVSWMAASAGGWLARLGTGLLQTLAALGLVVPLAVALNYIGSDQLNDIAVSGAMGQVILLSLGAVAVALVCRWATHRLSQQLLARLPRRQMRGVLALVGVVGLTLGGAAGLLLP
ncbi:hypothetical protein GFS31_09220 [Leptolyngbya sp. BL0902]|nr:hypothetical protein GFS31_09220 [Leptolyngbya sp. BL0902]